MRHSVIMYQRIAGNKFKLLRRQIPAVKTLFASAYIGSWPSDHYFRIVCLSVCLFVQSFSQPSLIRFRSN